MKFLVGLVFVFCSVNAFAGSLKISCKSKEKVEGWRGGYTNQYVYYKAEVADSKTLLNAQVSGAYNSDIRNLDADLDLANEYKTLRFGSLEDAWHWFWILVPKNFARKKRSFRATLQFTVEDYYGYNYMEMRCRVR